MGKQLTPIPSKFTGDPPLIPIPHSPGTGYRMNMGMGSTVPDQVTRPNVSHTIILHLSCKVQCHHFALVLVLSSGRDREMGTDMLIPLTK